jgi:integrase
MNTMSSSKTFRLSSIRDAYLDSKAFLSLSPGTQLYYRRSLLGLKLSRLNTSGLNGPTVRRLLAPLEDAPGAYNKARSAFSAMLTWAGGEYPVQIHNPLSAVPSQSMGHIERWAPGEAEKALGMVEGDLYTTILLMHKTAQRLSDVVRLKPTNLMGDKLVLRQKKTGTKITLGLDHETVAHLCALGRGGDTHYIGGHILPLRETVIQMRWVGARRRIFGPDSEHTLHGLRKGAACEAAEGGASPHQIKAMLGHKTIRAAMIYTEEVNAEAMAAQAQGMRVASA